MGLAVTRVKIRIPVLAGALAGMLAFAAGSAAQEGPWERPAAEMAHRIADVLGPATAHLSWTNLSSVPSDALPVIRRAVEHHLAVDGVNPAASDSANLVRITLSQDTRGGLWVAEVLQGNETRVVMVRADLGPAAHAGQRQKMAMQRRTIARSSELPWKEDPRDGAIPQIVAALERNGQLVVLTPSRLVAFQGSPAGWSESASAELGVAHAASRDPRGLVTASGEGFNAAAPGIACSAVSAGLAGQSAGSTLQCQASDDPWPIAQTAPGAWLRAFYNAGRNYFTGVVTPAAGADLPPFYTATILPGLGSTPALLAEQIDGKVVLLDGGELKPVSGTRDWGSDFAAIGSGCGSGSQVLVPSSGEAVNDSLRAYEISGQEAQPVSEPLVLEGTVIAIATAADGKTAIAIVRVPLAGGQSFDYEVDRVTATCD